MKYIILVIVGISIAYRFWSNYKVKSGTNKLANGLKSGKFTPDSFIEVYDILLLQKPNSGVFDNFSALNNFNGGAGLQVPKKFSISQVSVSSDKNKAVILATAKIKKATQYNAEEVDTVLPCNLLLINNTDKAAIEFFCECPLDHDHDFLIREFIDVIYIDLMKQIRA
jgi:hypothetical protein